MEAEGRVLSGTKHFLSLLLRAELFSEVQFFLHQYSFQQNQGPSESMNHVMVPFVL